MTPQDYRARIVALAQADVGVLEDPGPGHRGAIVREAFSGCVRNGKPLGIVEGLPWCAAWASLLLYRAAHPVAAAAAAAWPDFSAAIPVVYVWPVVGRRASVAEMCDDGRASGALHVEPQRCTCLHGPCDGGGCGYEPAAWEAWERLDGMRPGDLLIFGRLGESPLHGGHGHVVIVESGEGMGARTIGGDEAMGDGRIGVHRSTLPRAGEPLVAWLKVA